MKRRAFVGSLHLATVVTLEGIGYGEGTGAGGGLDSDHAGA